MSFRNILVGPLLGATLSLPALAATPLGDHFSVSGFGTLGGVVSDSDDAQYIRPNQARGAGTEGSLMVDSSLGLQLDARANSWLSATVQTLTAQRTTPHLTTRVEWGFVKLDPTDDLSVQLGRFTLPTFLISDSRRVGYANTWLRPADEVYGLAILDSPATGGKASYRFKVAGSQLTVTGLAGSMRQEMSGIGTLKVRNVRGLNAVWDGDWYTLRVGRITAEPQLPAGVLAAGQTEKYTFDGVGASVDRDNVVLQAEYVRRRSSNFNASLGANGWYVLGGYRFGTLLPYVERAQAKAVEGGAFSPQTTSAVGLRWDALRSAAFKFQLSHIDTHGTAGMSFLTPKVVVSGNAPATGSPVTHPVTTLSAAVDFVF